MKKKTFVVSLGIVTILEVILSIAVMKLFFNYDITLAIFITAAFILVLLVIYFSLDAMTNEVHNQIENNLEKSYKQALDHGDIGLLVYDDKFEITYESDFFDKRSMKHTGDKLLNWLPEIEDLVKNEANTKTIVINDDKYSIFKVEKENVLVFKNVTNEYDLKERLTDEGIVLGLLSYDNYDELYMSEDDLSFINSNIKVPVFDYFKKFGVIYKTLKNNSMLLLMNETTFKQIMNDRFSIINTVREVSKNNNLDVTLSLAFARGSNDYNELDEIAQDMLELTQTRGGDQVIVKKVNEDPTFFGGNSEAREKQSKTKVRSTAGTIADLVNKSSNVIIVGHKQMDSDCIGSALIMSNIVSSLNKQCFILNKSGGIESMINDVLNRYHDILDKKHNFISESEALNLLNDDTLVIMVDHHMAEQSNGANLLKQAKRIIIIDHHRRKADLDVVPLMFYIEAAASSTCEIVTEFLPYYSKNLDITPEEANIAYLGILIDTDHFRVRTGSRTFDVAKQLKKYGADPLLCDELSQESYDNVLQRSKIINAAKMYRDDIIISSLSEGIIPRSIASQACDVLIKAKEIEAAFVICNIDSNEVSISARSKGKINVQLIMEKMDGGGHMTAAGLQVKNITVEQLEADLIQVLDEYFKGDNNEGNTTE